MQKNSGIRNVRTIFHFIQVLCPRVRCVIQLLPLLFSKCLMCTMNKNWKIKNSINLLFFLKHSSCVLFPIYSSLQPSIPFTFLLSRALALQLFQSQQDINIP